MMFFLNMRTPLLADDYNYAFIQGGEARVSSISDIVLSMQNHYQDWGGRVLTHSIVQFFLMGDKLWFNIANALVFTILGLSLYFGALGRKIKPLCLFLTFFGLWFLTPYFGQICLWLSGSANYLWSSTLVVLALLPFRFYMENQAGFLASKIFSVLFLAPAVLAGMAHENVSGAMLFAFVLYFVLYRRNKLKIPAFFYTGMFAALSGYMFLMIAPGNFRRGATGFNEEVTALVGDHPLMVRLSMGAFNFMNILPVLLVFIVLFILLLNKNKKDFEIPLLLFLSAAASFAVMLLPSHFPPRALAITAFLLISASIYCLHKIEWPKGFSIAVIAASLYLVLSFSFAAIDSNEVFRQYTQREVEIMESIAEGRDVVYLERIDLMSRHNAMYGLKDISRDSKFWVNVAIAQYYEINEVRAR